MRPSGRINGILPIRVSRNNGSGITFSIDVVNDGVQSSRTICGKSIERVRGSEACVNGSLTINITPLLSIQHLMATSNGLQRSRVTEVNTKTVFLAAFGRYNNYTIGSTATIDRGRRSILEHLDRLDISRVERVEVLRCGNSVNDIKRIRAVNRANTADTDSTIASTRSRIGSDLHTC